MSLPVSLYQDRYKEKLDALLGLNAKLLVACKAQQVLKERGCLLTYLHGNERKKHIDFPCVCIESAAQNLSPCDSNLERLLSLVIAEAKNFARELSEQSQRCDKVHREVLKTTQIGSKGSFIITPCVTALPDACSSPESTLYLQAQEHIKQVKARVFSKYTSAQRKTLNVLLACPDLVASMVSQVQGFQPLLGGEYVKVEGGSMLQVTQWVPTPVSRVTCSSIKILQALVVYSVG